MDRLERDNLQYHLNRRLTTLEQLNSQLAAAGQTYRTIAALDHRLRESFALNGINFPAELKADGLREAVDSEFSFQILTGDPPRDSFLSAMSAPRATLYDQMREIHDQLTAEANRV